MYIHMAAQIKMDEDIPLLKHVEIITYPNSVILHNRGQKCTNRLTMIPMQEVITLIR